jgi:hypothetical protein
MEAAGKLRCWEKHGINEKSPAQWRFEVDNHRTKWGIAAIAISVYCRACSSVAYQKQFILIVDSMVNIYESDVLGGL